MDGCMTDKDTFDSDESVIEEARERFEQAKDGASDNRQSFKEAIAFVAGEQWDDKLKKAREGQGRPCLVLDRLTTHINQIVNDQRQNKPQIKVHPVDDFGDVKTAEVFDGLIRHIERVSNATTAYETAGFTQVAGGVGYWRILTDYIDDTAFEQDICIERVTNPLSIYFDPEAKEQDGSDGDFAFVIDEMPRKKFEKLYPKAKTDSWPGMSDTKGWYSEDTVRIAEYFRIVKEDVTLCQLADGSIVEKDDMPVDAECIAERPGKSRKVEWYKLGGRAVVDKREWVGKWIPIVRIVGNEIDQSGKLSYTGLTDRMMDAQRAYNYWNSVVTETVALQPKAPYIGAKGQFKGVEGRWANANNSNPSYLEYEPVELNGSVLPAPNRVPPPLVPQGAIQAVQLAAEDMQWISGQHAAQMGAPSAESSGRAIMAKERQGQTSTYHYVDNLARGIRHTGRILVDLIPKVYDTARVVRVLGDDGASDAAHIDPQMPGSMAKIQTPDGIQKIYNLNVGRYDVAVAVGPSYLSKRQESVEAMTQLLQANPAMWQIVGDLYLRNQDWPGAQQMADRLAKTVPPELQATGDDEGQEKQQIAQMQGALQQAEAMVQQQGQQLQGAQQLAQEADQEVQQLKGELQKLQFDMAAKTQDTTIKAQADMYRADVDRYKADAEMRIAEIEAQSEMANAQAQAAQTDLGGLQTGVEALRQAIESIAQAQSQPVVVDTSPIAAMLSQNKPPVSVRFVRQNGELVGATVSQ
jgi:Skp family chaperone for outer membrane proteins